MLTDIMAAEAKTLPPPSTEMALKVLKKALESTAKESVEHIGGYLLVQAVSTAVAGPGAAILGAAAGALVSALLEQTSAVEQKLDALIAEPLDTATAIIRDTLELNAATDDEKYEAREDLRDALRELRAAYSYAARLHPEQCLVIRLYQCIVLALMRGRRYQLTKYIAQLYDAAAECDNKALKNERLALDISQPFSDQEFEAMQGRLSEEGAAGALAGMSYANLSATDVKRHYEDTAQQERLNAERLRLFVQFIETLATRQQGCVG